VSRLVSEQAGEGAGWEVSRLGREEGGEGGGRI